MKTYINCKGSQGVETMDELDSKEFVNGGKFRAEVKRLVNEYQLSGHNAYASSRACKAWKERK